MTILAELLRVFGYCLLSNRSGESRRADTQVVLMVNGTFQDSGVGRGKGKHISLENKSLPSGISSRVLGFKLNYKRSHKK